MNWVDDTDSWTLSLDKKVSTDTEGIRRILAGATKETYPTIDKFMENVAKKLNQ
jgi:hypothetical protein